MKSGQMKRGTDKYILMTSGTKPSMLLYRLSEQTNNKFENVRIFNAENVF